MAGWPWGLLAATMGYQAGYEVLEVKPAEEVMEGTGLGWKV